MMDPLSLRLIWTLSRTHSTNCLPIVQKSTPAYLRIRRLDGAFGQQNINLQYLLAQGMLTDATSGGIIVLSLIDSLFVAVQVKKL